MSHSWELHLPPRGVIHRLSRRRCILRSTSPVVGGRAFSFFFLFPVSHQYFLSIHPVLLLPPASAQELVDQRVPLVIALLAKVQLCHSM